MKHTMSWLTLSAAIVCVTAGMAQARQTTTSSTETKSFQVIDVQGSKLIVRLPEGTRELDVPPDFRFMVNGQPLALSELKPGMKGTATITTKTTVTPVVVTEVKNGTVMQRSGGSLIVRTDKGIKMFSEGELEKRGVKLIKDGQPAQLTDFREGDRLSATIVTEHPPKVMTEKQVHATVPTATAANQAAGQASPARSSSSGGAAASTSTAATSGGTPGEPARSLPKTASSWPFVALASVLSLVLGLGLTIARRFVV